MRPHSDGYTWSARNPQVVRHVERNRRIDVLRLAESLGAETVTLDGPTAAAALIEYAQTRGATRIVVVSRAGDSSPRRGRHLPPAESDEIGGELEEARPGDSIVITLEDELDISRGELTGDPVTLAASIGAGESAPVGFSVSRTGVVAYRAGGGSPLRTSWFDRTGNVLGQLAGLNAPEVSPDTVDPTAPLESVANAATRIASGDLDVRHAGIRAKVAFAERPAAEHPLVVVQIGLRAQPAAGEVARRGLVSAGLLRRMGVAVDDQELRATGALLADGWLMSEERATNTADQVSRAVAEHERQSPLAGGLPLSVLAERLGLPSVELVRAVVRPPLRVESGRVRSGRAAVLPEGVQRAVEAVRRDLEEDPFAAPTADRLREVGLENTGAAAAAKAGLLLRPAPGIVLLPGADLLAAKWLAELPQPFTTSEARVRLGTSRRVVLPLLAHLDKAGLTRRHPDDRREVTG